MRQSEFKKTLDPELGIFTRQHIWSGERSIYGEGITDVFKSFGKKIFGKTVKKAAKKGVEKAVTAAATKTGEHAGKKAGDKIVQLLLKGEAPKTRLLKNPPTKKVTFNENVETIPSKKLTQKEINQRVNSILSGGKLYNY